MIKKVEVWEKLSNNRWPTLVEKKTYFLGILLYKFVRAEFGADLVDNITKEEKVKVESKLVTGPEIIEEAVTAGEKERQDKYNNHNNKNK